MKMCKHEGEWMRQPWSRHWKCLECDTQVTEGELAILMEIRRMREAIDPKKPHRKVVD